MVLRRRARWILLFGMAFGIANPRLWAEDAKPSWNTVMAARPGGGLQVPQKLVKKIEKDYKSYRKSQGVLEDKKINLKMMNVSVQFTQDKMRALQGPTRVEIPLGGGMIDLADVLTTVPGAFFVKFNLTDAGQPVMPDKVYFISESKKVQIDKKFFGAGCGVYLDITSYFRKAMSGHGWQLYTSDQRYLPVLRGTFIFVSHRKDSLRMAGLTFLDSRFQNADCPVKEESHGQ